MISLDSNVLLKEKHKTIGIGVNFYDKPNNSVLENGDAKITAWREKVNAICSVNY